MRQLLNRLFDIAERAMTVVQRITILNVWAATIITMSKKQFLVASQCIVEGPGLFKAQLRFRVH